MAANDEPAVKPAQTQTLNSGPHPEGYIWGQLPVQKAPEEPADPDAVASAKKTPGPTGKATPEQAFFDPKGHA